MAAGRLHNGDRVPPPSAGRHQLSPQALRPSLPAEQHPPPSEGDQQVVRSIVDIRTQMRESAKFVANPPS